MSDTTDLHFRSARAALPLTTGELELVAPVHPDGRTIGATNYYLTLDGSPFPIVSGELIPQRYPVAEWRDAIRALRDGGCTIVSSYVFWSLVEQRPGSFDFTGANDIRRFADLCAEEGMLFAPRIGPFNNSEFLVGGLPPWLFGMPVVERSDDPGYLKLVGAYYAAVGEQFSGRYWSDGGPIIFVQLENELAHAPNDWQTVFRLGATGHRGPEGEGFGRHMSSLRTLALDAGIAPAFFTMTAWRARGELPGGKFLPTYAGYIDLVPRPGTNSPLTTFGGVDLPHRGRFPITFSELGTGSPTRDDYRPTTAPDLTLTAAITRVGAAETTAMGYYLFHGGTNPVTGEGFGWTTKGVGSPLRSYDFWAPVSEFGERRETFYALAPLNRFLREFMPELAVAAAVSPVDPVIDPDDDRLRAALRTDGRSGFVLLSNLGNNLPLSDRSGIRITVETDDGLVSIPRREPLGLRSGGNLVLPVNLELGHGVVLESATAWPQARLGRAELPTVVFAATQERVEYTVRRHGVESVDAPVDAEVVERDGVVTVILTAGADGALTLMTGSGPVRVVTLTLAEAERALTFEHAGSTVLVTSPDELSLGDGVLSASRLRPLDGDGSASTSLRVLDDRGLRTLQVSLPDLTLPRAPLEVREISPRRHVLRLRQSTGEAVSRLWADIDYRGDLCRLFDACTGILVGDDLSRGIPWRLRLGRFANQLEGAGLQLRLEPRGDHREVDDPEGSLLDNASIERGEARLAGLRFFEKVTTRLSLHTVLE
jgi:beta-galactosidase